MLVGLLVIAVAASAAQNYPWTKVGAYPNPLPFGPSLSNLKKYGVATPDEETQGQKNWQAGNSKAAKLKKGCTCQGMVDGKGVHKSVLTDWTDRSEVAAMVFHQTEADALLQVLECNNVLKCPLSCLQFPPQAAASVGTTLAPQPPGAPLASSPSVTPPTPPPGPPPAPAPTTIAAPVVGWSFQVALFQDNGYFVKRYRAAAKDPERKAPIYDVAIVGAPPGVLTQHRGERPIAGTSFIVEVNGGIERYKVKTNGLGLGGVRIKTPRTEVREVVVTIVGDSNTLPPNGEVRVSGDMLRAVPANQPPQVWFVQIE